MNKSANMIGLEKMAGLFAATTEQELANMLRKQLGLKSKTVYLDRPIKSGYGADDWDTFKMGMDMRALYGHDVPDNLIKKNTTLQDLLDWVNKQDALDPSKRKQIQPTRDAYINLENYIATHKASDLYAPVYKTYLTSPNALKRYLNGMYPLYTQNPNKIEQGSVDEPKTVLVTKGDLYSRLQDAARKEYLANADIALDASEWGPHSDAGIRALRKVIKNHNVPAEKIPAFLGAVKINSEAEAVPYEYAGSTEGNSAKQEVLANHRARLLSNLGRAAEAYLHNLPEYKNTTEANLVYDAGSGNVKHASANMAGIEKAAGDIHPALIAGPLAALIMGGGSYLMNDAEQGESEDDFKSRRITEAVLNGLIGGGVGTAGGFLLDDWWKTHGGNRNAATAHLSPMDVPAIRRQLESDDAKPLDQRIDESIARRKNKGGRTKDNFDVLSEALTDKPLDSDTWIQIDRQRTQGARRLSDALPAPNDSVR